ILQTIPGGTLTAGAFGSGFLNNAPYLYTAAPSYVPAAAGQPGEIQLTVTRRTPAQLNFNASEAGALDAVLNAIPNDPNIEKVVLAQTTEVGLKSAYDQLLPDQGQGIFESLDAAAQAISSMTDTTPDAGTRVPGTSLWLQEVNERVDRSGITSLGSQSQLLGIVAGTEHTGAAGGAIGATLAYMNAQEEVNGGAVGEHVVGSLVEGGVYYRRADGPLTVSARGGAGYAWFNDVRRFLAPGAVNNANSDWGAYFVDAHAGAGYEIKLGRYYVRPELSLDYLRLAENGHSETGGGPGFDLTYGSRTSTRFSGQAEMVLGEQWGKVAWLRTEIRAGYREIFAGNVGDTVANFEGGSPFALAADPDQGGWATVGFSIKGGTPYSYVALEGDADFRAGEQRYDLRVAGRSMF
ncbi:MAG: autotransporter outer membrane beta-barrel domain-containing protein, partial [Caulobacteraceae bacterium]